MSIKCRWIVYWATYIQRTHNHFQSIFAKGELMHFLNQWIYEIHSFNWGSHARRKKTENIWITIKFGKQIHWSHWAAAMVFSPLNCSLFVPINSNADRFIESAEKRCEKRQTKKNCFTVQLSIGSIIDEMKVLLGCRFVYVSIYHAAPRAIHTLHCSIWV